jgi:hypothetical protein
MRMVRALINHGRAPSASGDAQFGLALTAVALALSFLIGLLALRRIRKGHAKDDGVSAAGER